MLLNYAKKIIRDINLHDYERGQKLNRMKEFTLKQMFNIVDGRLSTCMDDIYHILNIATGENLTTIALPIAMDKVAEIKPVWYMQALNDLEAIKAGIGNDFETLMKHLDGVTSTYNVEYMVRGENANTNN